MAPGRMFFVPLVLLVIIILPVPMCPPPTHELVVHDKPLLVPFLQFDASFLIFPVPLITVMPLN